MPDSTPDTWAVRPKTMDAGRLAILKDDVVTVLSIPDPDVDMPTIPATDVHALLCHMEHRAEVLMQRDREVVKLRESGDAAAGRIKDLEEKLPDEVG